MGKPFEKNGFTGRLKFLTRRVKKKKKKIRETEKKNAPAPADAL